MKKLLGVLLAITMVFALLPTFAFAADGEEPVVVRSGTCGENAVYTVTSDRVMTISGTGTIAKQWKQTYTNPDDSLSGGFDTVVISEGITAVGDSAFQGWEFKKLVLPDSLESIGYSAFTTNWSLCEIEWGNGIKTVGASAFLACSPIKELVLPSSLRSIGDSAFFDCEKLERVVFSEGLEQIGNGAFDNCTALESVTFVEGLRTIGAQALRACPVRELDLPDSLETIGEEAFFGCKNLEYLRLGPNVASIGSGAFSSCTGLKGAIIDSPIQELPFGLFSGDTALEWVVIPDSVTKLGASMFRGCKSLEYVRLPVRTEVIPQALFMDCSALRYITMPAATVMIEQNAFLHCDSLELIAYNGTEAQLNQLQYYAEGNEVLQNIGVYLAPAYPDYWYGFYDMPDRSEWSYEGIAFCLDNGYMNGMGVGYFQPNGTTTRAQLVTILWRMCEEPAAAKAADFADAQDHWAKDAISWAAENGIVNGVGEGLFAPDAPITREQLVTIFHRFCKEYLEMDVSQTKKLDAYPDSAAVSDWAKDAMEWGVGVKLISGVATRDGAILQPQGSATRAQIAKVILNFFENVYTG